MALNDPDVPHHAEMARAAQDVGAPAMRQTEQTGEAFVHHGRGGGGNAIKLERMTSNEGNVINGEERDVEENNGDAVAGGRRGSMDKLGNEERRRGRSIGGGRIVDAGPQQPQQLQQGPGEVAPQQPRPDVRQGSASRISGLMERLRSPSGKRDGSA